MKPGDHPDFFRFAPPPGASRESTIVLDVEGRFFHDGQRVAHPALERALHGWIARHPVDGRLILTNGYDWCYFRAEGSPAIVSALRVEDEQVQAVLLDGTVETLDIATLTVDRDGVVHARVRRGEFDARFTRHAQTQLGPILVEGDPPRVRLGAVDHVIGPWRADARDAAPGPTP